MLQERRLYGGVGLGTFPFAGAFSTVDDSSKAAILDSYFELGGYYLDTAPTYGLGKVEEFLGSYLSGRPRDSFAVSTSAGFVLDRVTGQVRVSGRRDDVLREVDQSLSRLRLDYLDVYISHTPDPHTPKHETAQALALLKSRGLVRHIGVSNVTYGQLREYAEAAPLDVVQNRFSYLNRELDDQLIRFCDDRKISIVAYQVIERGHLTDRGVSLDRMSEKDLRRRKPEFHANRIELVRSLVDTHMRPIAAKLGMPLEELAIRWCVNQPAIGLAQVGATTRQQVEALPLREQFLPLDTLESLEIAYGEMVETVRAAGYATMREALGLDEPTPQSATGA